MEKLEFELLGERVEYTLRTEERNNMRFRVYPDQRVEIVAPERSSIDDINSKIEKRKRWIVQQLNNFDRYYGMKNSLEYRSGETVSYLGRKYIVKIIKSDLEDVKLKSGVLNIYTIDPNNKVQIENTLNNWWNPKAINHFNKILDKVYPKVRPYGIDKPSIKLRKMEKRWGSCIQSKGIINLNPELLKVSKYAIEYVIIHELAHFKFANHSQSFYRFLRVLMPDWDEREYVLSREVV